ncbi:hypothetical protein J6590_043697 [Homalodisca vitripennis]|nr:hypothetical protein J6590_043697 [Homalodisca vitripennis]
MMFPDSALARSSSILLPDFPRVSGFSMLNLPYRQSSSAPGRATMWVTANIDLCRATENDSGMRSVSSLSHRSGVGESEDLKMNPMFGQARLWRTRVGLTHS